MRTTSLLALVVTLAACTSGTGSAPPPPAGPAGIPESAIGLAPGTTADQPPQPPIPFNRDGPGDSTPRPRPNPEFPPVVSHSLDGIDPITTAANPCLECHLGEAAADVGATAIPPSHFVDFRRDPGVAGDELAATRYNCTACHVAQTGAPPLVENTS